MQEKTKAILWAALGRAASKEGRGLRPPQSSSTRVDLRVIGRVGRSLLPADGVAIVGDLVVGVPGERTKTSTPTIELVAYLLGQLPYSRRMRILEELPETAGNLGQIPDVTQDLLEEAKNLATRLATREKVATPATVSFKYNAGVQVAAPKT